MLIYRPFFLVALCALSLLGCHKEDGKEDVYWGEARASKKNMPWVAKPYAVYGPLFYGNKDTFDIVVEWFNDQGFRKEILGFSRLTYKKGVYKIGVHNINNQKNHGITAPYDTVQSDGDVQGDSYDLDTLANNTLEIVDFNKSKHEMTIKFDATFVMKTRRVASSPERVVFKDGYVRTRVYNP